MGGGTEKDGTEIAGSKIIIENNTFFSSKKAIKIRGIPENFALISKNIFFKQKLGPKIIEDWPLYKNVRVFNNLYDSERVLRNNYE